MAFKGMDPEAGRETANLVKEAATVLSDTHDSVNSEVMSVAWVGPDYDNFTNDWTSYLSGAKQALADAYTAKADELNKHADEQDDTSNQG